MSMRATTMMRTMSLRKLSPHRTTLHLNVKPTYLRWNRWILIRDNNKLLNNKRNRYLITIAKIQIKCHQHRFNLPLEEILAHLKDHRSNSKEIALKGEAVAPGQLYIESVISSYFIVIKFKVISLLKFEFQINLKRNNSRYLKGSVHIRTSKIELMQ